MMALSVNRGICLFSVVKMLITPAVNDGLASMTPTSTYTTANIVAISLVYDYVSQAPPAGGR